jgi:carbon-monoxide dehydrogenase large subunit
MPTAADTIALEVSNTETPSPHNPLGAKGIGESATIGSTPAVQNAVVDALAHLGVRHIDLPCTPERVWRAIRAGGDADLWREPPSVFDHLSNDGGEPDIVEA